MAGDFDPYYKWLGIPPKDQPPHYYRLLGVELFEADPEVIALAAEQRVLHVRSFQSGQYAIQSQKIQKKIEAAKRYLLDPEKKAEYDISLRLQLHLLPEQQRQSPERQKYIEPPPIAQPHSENTDYSINPVVIAKETVDWFRNHKKVVSLTVKLCFASLLLIVLLVVAVNGKGLWTFIFDQVAKISGSTEEKLPERRTRIRTIPGSNSAGAETTAGQKNGSIAPSPGANGSSNVPLPPPTTDAAAAQVTQENSQPAVTPTMVAPSPAEPPIEITVLNLPSGKTFKPRLFKVNIVNIIESLKDLAKDDQILLLEDPLGRICALTEHKQGVLDGMLVAYNESRLPSLYASFADGDLDGFVKIWNEKGERVFWCQYEKGAPNGFCCYFKNDSLRLLLEIDQDKIHAVHLCAKGKLDKTFPSVEEASADKDVQALLVELENVEADLKINLEVYKKTAKDEYLLLRHERKAAVNPQKKAVLQNHLNRYAVEKQSLVNPFWQYKGW
jgi:hypothetical protein